MAEQALPQVVTCNIGVLGDHRCKKRPTCRGRCAWLPDEAGIRCYVCCGQVSDDADPRNPLCERCAPVREHIISMAGSPAAPVSQCQCGWRHAAGDRASQEAAIAAHWLSVIEEAGK